MARRSTYDFQPRKSISALTDPQLDVTSSEIYDLPPSEDVVEMHIQSPEPNTSETYDDVAPFRENDEIYDDVPTETDSSAIYDLPPAEDVVNEYDPSPNKTNCKSNYDISNGVSPLKDIRQTFHGVSTNGDSFATYDDGSSIQTRVANTRPPATQQVSNIPKMSPTASNRPLPDVPTTVGSPGMHRTVGTELSCESYETSDMYLEVLPALTPVDGEHVYEELGTLSRTDQQQQMAVSELINTECSYVQELELLAGHIRTQLQQIPAIAVEDLLSNTDEICRVSQAFLEELKKSDSQEQDQLCAIGNLFVEYSLDMELVYRVYCADYKKALSLLDGYKKDAALYKEIHDRINAVMPQVVPDLSFLLVKPVQRITKYPLMLKKILETVPTFDRAYDILNKASTAIEEVNCNINQFKRNKEVATKYVKKEQLTLKDRVSRINTHSLTKKTARLGQMLKHEAGIVPRVDDKEFHLMVENFQRLASRVNELKENVASYMNNLEAFLSAKPHTCELDIPEGAVLLYRHLADHSHQHVFAECKRRLQKLTFQPLCNLSEALEGPQLLIKKRMVKLLDYEQLEEKMAEIGSVNYEEEDTMNTYRAINSMLISELPRVNEQSVQWLRRIVGAFVVIQKDLAKEVLQATNAVMSQLPHCQVPHNLFWKTIEDSLRTFDPQLSQFCKNFEVDMPGPSAEQSLSPKSEKLVLSLVNKHGADKLYHVTGNISGSRELDLTLQRGDIVALLQAMDTKGNKSRWLVDAGGRRGYVPSSKLQPYHLPQSPRPARQSLLLPENGMERRRHSYTIQETPRPPVYITRPVFQTVAGYAFMARSPQEVTIQVGQPVNILEPHDKKGSTEWSLVEVNGQKGYVPSSFLVTVPVQPPVAWSGRSASYSAQHT